MPFDCRFRSVHGHDACLTGCPTRVPGAGYQYLRVERGDPAPPVEPSAVDVAILDMNHGWPNLGHDAIVHAVQNIACDLLPDLIDLGLRLRVVSYDVRRGHRVPPPPGGTCAVYVGTGGPGHIDPARNTGDTPESQGIVEDGAWEAETFRLFDAIRADEHAALLGVCHTFGVMCRWLGVARPVLRSVEKGGKSSGVLENVLTDDARRHPWFSRFASMLPDGRRLRILDSRFFDLVPEPDLPAGLAIGYETRGDDARPGEAITMIEVARDHSGRMPRVFGVNHHPEVVNRPRQLTILRERLSRGDVTAGWYEERARLLTETMPDEDSDFRLRLTSSYTLFAPLRYYVYRQVRERAESRGRRTAVHEGLAPLAADDVSLGLTSAHAAEEELR